jgi:branched-chain amino acid transport system substrate-binding protein
MTTARIAFLISSRMQRPALENPIYRGATIAIENVRADATLPVALDWEVFDDHGETKRTEDNARRIAADPSFVAAVGPMSSGEALVCAPIFHEAGLLQVSPSASLPKLCQSGYTTFHRLLANEDAQGGALALAALRLLGARTMTMINADDVWGNFLTGLLGREFEKLGGKVAGHFKYKNETMEFAALVRDAAATNAAVYFFAVHPIEGTKLSGELRAAGVTAPFLGTDAMKTAFFLGGAPGAEAYHTHTGGDFRHLSTAREFRRAYAARWPEDSAYSPEGHDAIAVVAEAVRRAGGPDRPKILAAVRNGFDFTGVTGRIRFTPEGERVDAPVGFYQVKKGPNGLEMAYLGTTVELLAAGALR